MEEPENAAAMDEVLRRDGITLITGTTAAAVAGSERGVTVELSDGTHVEGERLLVAPGEDPICARSASPGWASTRTRRPLRPMRISARVTAYGQSGT
ncbi:MAG TPA: FAD-dependent oxidoreductase [Streptosporangiaceae bacterium]|nr:FAD-dependent oxidoreductase [Streptosporangiaceae bacterium]